MDMATLVTIEGMALGLFSLLGMFFLYVARAYVANDREWKKELAKDIKLLRDEVAILRQNGLTREEVRALWKEITKLDGRLVKVETRQDMGGGRQGG
jgi:hypothetical protein